MLIMQCSKCASPLASDKFFLAGCDQAHGVKAKQLQFFPSHRTKPVFSLPIPLLPSHDARVFWPSSQVDASRAGLRC